MPVLYWHSEIHCQNSHIPKHFRIRTFPVSQLINNTASDTAIIDFEGFLDGAPFDGGKGENHSLELGSRSFVPGFEEQVIGMKAGEEKDIDITFPEDYHADLAGKAVVFHVKVNEVKESQAPEVDDEFAKDVSEFDTLAEYREDVKATLTKEKEDEARAVKEEKLIEQIVEDAQMDIPEAMLETQQNSMAEDFAQRIQMQGISIEQYYQFTGLTKAALLEQLKPQAEQKIKSRLVLEAVAKAEGIETSDEEYNEEIKKMAEAYQMTEEKLTGIINEYERRSIREDISIRKALDFVVENAVEK